MIEGKKLFMSFVDLEKAFDRVPNILLECQMGDGHERNTTLFGYISDEFV